MLCKKGPYECVNERPVFIYDPFNKLVYILSRALQCKAVSTIIYFVYQAVNMFKRYICELKSKYVVK